MLLARWLSDTFTHAGLGIPYAIRASARARAPSLWISPAAGLVVVWPARAPAPTSGARDTFLRRHAGWIVREWTALLRRFGSPARRWPYGPETLLEGQAHAVTIAIDGVAGVFREPGRLTIRPRTPTLDAAHRLLTRWRIEQARRVLAARAAARAQAMGLAWRRLSVGDGRSRWGSCYPSGALHFSWRLIMAPPEALDYVVVHELCHRVHFNHSPAFWGLVARHAPQFAEARAWLRRYGPTLE